MTSRILNMVVGGMPVKKIASLSITAAIAGLGCGKCYRNLKQHPDTGHNILKYAIIGGVTGGTLGLTVGLWVGRKTLMLTLTQTMYGYVLAGTYLNIRSVVSNEKFILPGRTEPIDELVVSSFSAGITGMIPAILFKAHPSFIFTGFASGIVLGFLGHFAYDYLCYQRLEYLLRVQHPDLIQKHREAEEYMIDKQRTDYYYTGPIKELPEWMQKMKRSFGDITRRSQEREL